VLSPAIIEVVQCAAVFSKANPRRMGDCDPPVVTAFCTLADELLRFAPDVFCSAVPVSNVQGILSPGSVSRASIPLLEVLVMALAKLLHLQDRDASKVLVCSPCWCVP